MRLTPAQIAVRLICGESLPRMGCDSLPERIREGHDFLIKITGMDFGYDLEAWHDHLKVSRAGGYTYGRNIVLPRIMQAALQSQEWQRAVFNLTNQSIGCSAAGAWMVRKGERYRGTAPLKVIAMTAWFAPCTGGEDAVLPAGEEFVVSNDPPEGATAVYCDPVRYDELHAHFVSAKDRRNKLYSEYYLCIDLGLIADHCERVAG